MVTDRISVAIRRGFISVAMRRGLLTALLVTVAAVGWATGFIEYTIEEEESTQTAESADGGNVAIPDASAADASTPDAPERPAPFVPTVRYPDTLFLPIGPRILGDVDVVNFLAAVEADRRLLSELRKPVPDTREDATTFLNRLKRLAELSDPTRLAIVASRVLEQAPIYFDWLETEFESEQDQLYEYYIGGAQGFNRAYAEFENAVLMTAINRLDTASRIIQESVSADE